MLFNQLLKCSKFLTRLLFQCLLTSLSLECIPRYISCLHVRIGLNTGIIETSISPVVRKFSRFRLTDALCITPGESLGHGYFARRVQSSKLGSTLVSNNPSCKAPPTIRIAYSACRSRVTGRFNFTRGKFQNGF